MGERNWPLSALVKALGLSSSGHGMTSGNFNMVLPELCHAIPLFRQTISLDVLESGLSKIEQLACPSCVVRGWCNRLAAQKWVGLLFNGGEVRVEIDVEDEFVHSVSPPFEGGARGGYSKFVCRIIYIALDF